MTSVMNMNQLTLWERSAKNLDPISCLKPENILQKDLILK